MKNAFRGMIAHAREPRRTGLRFIAVAWIALMGTLTLLVFTTGCEDGGHRPLGHGHDFGPNQPDLCLALGDSITSGEENPGPSYPQLLEAMLGKRVINRGRGAHTTENGRQVVGGTVASVRPGFVLILYGINDVIHHRPIEDAAENLRAIIQAVKAAQAIPIVATLTPVANSYRIYAERVTSLNQLIRRMAREEQTVLVDLESGFGWNPIYLRPDGLHPNTAGHERIAALFHNALR
jgi:lysophospholipase L1-like esterase